MGLKIENPDKIEFTLTRTMTLAAWKKLREQMSEAKDYHWPMSDLVDDIREMVSKAEKEFYPE